MTLINDIAIIALVAILTFDAGLLAFALPLWIKQLLRDGK